jgi:transposase
MKQPLSTVAVPTLSAAEAASRLCVTPATIRRWCKNSGFGILLCGQYRVAESRVVEIEQTLLTCGTGLPSIGDGQR